MGLAYLHTLGWFWGVNVGKYASPISRVWAITILGPESMSAAEEIGTGDSMHRFFVVQMTSTPTDHDRPTREREELVDVLKNETADGHLLQE